MSQQNQPPDLLHHYAPGFASFLGDCGLGAAGIEALRGAVAPVIAAPVKKFHEDASLGHTTPQQKR